MRATTSPSLRDSTENTPLSATLSGVVRSRTEGETGMPTESHQPWRATSAWAWAWAWAWGWGKRGTGRAAQDERRGGGGEDGPQQCRARKGRGNYHRFLPRLRRRGHGELPPLEVDDPSAAMARCTVWQGRTSMHTVCIQYKLSYSTTAS